MIQGNLVPASGDCLVPRAAWGCLAPQDPPVWWAHRVHLGCQDKWGRVANQVCLGGMVCRGRTANQGCLGSWAYQDHQALPAPKGSQGMQERRGRASLALLVPRARRVSRRCWRACCWVNPAPKVPEVCLAPRVRRGSLEELGSLETPAKMEPRDHPESRGKRALQASVCGDHQDRMGLQA